MSAIDTTFTWCRNPTAINGLATTYISKRGSDTTGDGTSQNPYASLAKATAMATANTNIMLDDGEWSEARTSNNRIFHWWGNGRTVFSLNPCYVQEDIHNAIEIGIADPSIFVDCIIVNAHFTKNYSFEYYAKECIFYGCVFYGGGNSDYGLLDCIIVKCTKTPINPRQGIGAKNTFFYSSTINGLNNSSVVASFCNFGNCTMPIATSYINSINDTNTGQTIADYFNYVHPNVLANPSTASIEDWLQCDFTAKAGSKNIGAGEKGTNIGLNQGYTMYADNSANDMFSPSNGATLKNIAWDSNLNGYVLLQKERVCQGATATTITLDSEASSQDDYYNNLFVGIVSGDGYGELFLITDYDGATKTATIDGTWATTPTTNSIYTISGTILSAVKDFGKAIKVKRNWTFADNFTALQDGQWAEFLTNLTSQGKEFPVNCFLYEYSLDGTNWMQGHTSDDLVSATNGENKVYDKIYGDCSPNYDEANAKELVMRYIRVRVHICFNILNYLI